MYDYLVAIPSAGLEIEKIILSAVVLTQISACGTHKNPAVCKIMEAMHTGYKTKRESVLISLKQDIEMLYSFYLFLFIGTHYQIFVRKFLVHLCTVYASPQKLMQPLNFTCT